MLLTFARKTCASFRKQKFEKIKYLLSLMEIIEELFLKSSENKDLE